MALIIQYGAPVDDGRVEDDTDDLLTVGRAESDLQRDRSAHRPAHEQDPPRPAAMRPRDRRVDVAPFRRSECVRAGTGARCVAVVAVGHDERRDAERVEDGHGTQALRPRRAAPMDLDDPVVRYLAVRLGREEPRGARAESRRDVLLCEGKMQLLRLVEVPAAERRLRRQMHVPLDLGEELPLDRTRVTREHRADLQIVGRTRREQTVASRERGVGSPAQSDGLSGDVDVQDARVGRAARGHDDAASDTHRDEGEAGSHRDQGGGKAHCGRPEHRAQRDRLADSYVGGGSSAGGGSCVGSDGAPGCLHRPCILV